MARKHKEALIIYGSLAPGEKNHFVMQDIPGEWLNATIHACIEDNGWSTRTCLLYTSPSPRDRQKSRMPSSA